MNDGEPVVDLCRGPDVEGLADTRRTTVRLIEVWRVHLDEVGPGGTEEPLRQVHAARQLATDAIAAGVVGVLGGPVGGKVVERQQR
jgi:hypothetical protein